MGQMGGAGGGGMGGGMGFMQNLQQNPWFNMGMGIMQNNGRPNPVANGVMQGMQQSNYMNDYYRMLEEEQRRKEAMEKLAAIFASQGPGRLSDQNPRGRGWTGGMQRGAPGRVGGLGGGILPGKQSGPADRMNEMLGVMMSSGDPQLTSAGVNLMSSLMAGSGRTANQKDLEYYMALDPETRKIWDQMNSRQQNTPANIQEYRLLEQMTPEQRELWFQNKRASQLYDVGGVAHRLDPSGQNTEALATVDDVANNEAVRQQAKSAAGAIGTAQGEAAVEIGPMIAQSEAVIGMIDKLIKHPGRESLSGMSSVFPTIPGTHKADAEALAEQVQGQAFLQARDQLKGQGVISDGESAKAEAAFSRLQQAQSDEAYVEALEDMKSIIMLGIERMRMRAGTQGFTPQPTKAAPAENAINWSDL